MNKPGLTVETVARRIHVVRGQRVILDADLAELYGTTTKRLNEQVKRNRARFPADFMFQLTATEEGVLRSQIATSKAGRGGRRYLAQAFTEHGAIMAANILNSSRAVRVSILVVRISGESGLRVGCLLMRGRPATLMVVPKERIELS